MTTDEEMAPPTIAGVPRPLALVYIGTVLTIPEAVLNLTATGAYELDGASLAVLDSGAVTVVLAGVAISLALLAYAVQVEGEPTGRNYLVVGWLAVASLIVGTLLLHLLTLLGASLGYWRADD